MCMLVIRYRSIQRMIKKFQLQKSVTNTPHRPWASRLTTQQAIFIDEALTSNDELTSPMLNSLLSERWPELHSVPLSIKE